MDVDKVTIECDGGCSDNDDTSAEGIGGYGFVVKEDGENVYSDNGVPDKVNGEMTNNIAEYRAVINALEYVRDKYPDTEVLLMTDSQLVDGHINKGWNRGEKMDILYKQATELLHEVNVEISRIDREDNTEADALADEAKENPRAN